MKQALRKIQAELEALAANATDEQPIDPHSVRVAAMKVGAQAEMIEKGLTE